MMISRILRRTAIRSSGAPPLASVGGSTEDQQLAIGSMARNVLGGKSVRYFSPKVLI